MPNRMRNSSACDGGGRAFRARDDAGGLISSMVGCACVRWWYIRSGGGAGATNGAGTIGGTSRGTSSMVEEKK